MKPENILIVGVGGQGTLLASRIMGTLFMNAGLDVKLSEVHGMAQRGGSVVTYVRAGQKVASPLAAPGEADIIISFELLEALRWRRYLRKGGRIITCVEKIPPMPVITGAAEYPGGIIETIREEGLEVIPVDALTLAEKAGDARSLNVVMLGAASRFMQAGLDWDRALRETIRPAFLEMNLEAFRLGQNYK